MYIQPLKPELLVRYRRKLLLFTQLYGDQRITKKAIQWLTNVSSEELKNKGNLILIATDNQQIVGLLTACNYGIATSYIVVHPSSRGMGVGHRLITSATEQMGKFHCIVATDNIASMRMCFSADLLACKLFFGVTGKPTLWFAGGNWNKSEIPFLNKEGENH